MSISQKPITLDVKHLHPFCEEGSTASLFLRVIETMVTTKVTHRTLHVIVGDKKFTLQLTLRGVNTLPNKEN